LFRDIVVIGASAGGLKALQQLVAYLPAELPATVLISTHLAPTAPSKIAPILGKTGPLPVANAVDGQTIVPGHIYTAVPDRHLVLDDKDVLRLSRGPRENRVRPAVDALFRSAARWCGPRVIGVVLSGSLDDGAAGLAAIAECGGVALVQDPGDATFEGMPRAALRSVPGAEALSAPQLARRVTELAGRTVRPSAVGPADTLIWETDMVRETRSEQAQGGTPVGLGCPECGGGMKAVTSGNSVHYICHTGHSYSPETFLAARQEGVEAALWTALSAMQERAMVLGELAGQAARSGDEVSCRRHEQAAAEVARAADLLRRHLIDGDIGLASGDEESASGLGT
jgi:two-component system chemotaxis response regulator CheB